MQKLLVFAPFATLLFVCLRLDEVGAVSGASALPQMYM
jgi:hypothetical protein